MLDHLTDDELTERIRECMNTDLGKDDEGFPNIHPDLARYLGERSRRARASANEDNRQHWYFRKKWFRVERLRSR